MFGSARMLALLSLAAAAGVAFLLAPVLDLSPCLVGPALLISMWAVLAVGVARRARGRLDASKADLMRSAGMCPACGYFVRVPTDRCPECGTSRTDP